MMKRLTSARLALWAALPMAHTSEVERRLTLILDPARSRRRPTRRITLIALGLGAAALVPLAALRPAAHAQAAASAPASPVASSVAPASEVFTPWTSFYIVTTWGPGKTYRPVEHLAPRVQGDYPDPPVRAVLVSGLGHVANLSVRLWKPGKSNLVTVSYDYTPV